MDSNYMIASYESNLQTKLAKNDCLLQSKLAQITDLQYEAELIKADSVNIIRGIADHVQLTDLHKIWCDFDHDKGKFKPDGKDSKTRLKFIEENYLFSNGIPKDLKLKDITLYSFCWELWLKYVRDKEEFIITLPFFKNATKDNYKDLSYSIMTVDKCSYTTVFKTRILFELKDGVSKFLGEEGI